MERPRVGYYWSSSLSATRSELDFYSGGVDPQGTRSVLRLCWSGGSVTSFRPTIIIHVGCASRRRRRHKAHRRNDAKNKLIFTNNKRKQRKMNIAEIRELENSRKSPDMYGRIHFVKEGNFYRAHDISAWLISMMPFSEAIKNIKIFAKKLKDGYIDAWLGFPLTSLEKIHPQRRHGDVRTHQRYTDRRNDSTDRRYSCNLTSTPSARPSTTGR